MGDPVLMTVVGVGAALTKMFLRACDAASAADLIGDGQELLGTLLRALRRTDESRGQIERRVSQTLANRLQAMQRRYGSQSVDPVLLSGACTEVEIILDKIANDDALLLSAVRSPESFPEKLRDYAAERRTNVESAAEPYFDELIEAAATQYAAFAPWSPRFQIEAFKSILSGIDEINDKSRRSLQAHEMTHEMLDTVLSNLAEVTRHEDKPRRILFGSRPDVAIGSSFVARVEQDKLNELITDTTKQRTVLVGMRGCGKTQLAAALAKQCEDANWSLVAWVNAVSPESIKSALVELAKELKLDTSDQPTQEQIIGRCLNSLRSSEASDRLVIFDNVESINDLRGLVPTGDGLRVVATTTNNTGWDSQGWGTITVGVFDREKSINYLLNTTSSTDHKAADTLAHRLGDLPLALAQAATTARNGNLSLARYLDRLDSYGSEPAIRPVPGDYYADDVTTALCMSIEVALENLADATRQSARRQLGALALLAESGVPTRWLDPTIEQQDDWELQGTNPAEDEDTHDALTELIHRSIVQQSTDGSTTMLHRLQAQAFRESWAENEAAEAYQSAAILLGKVSIDQFPTNDADSRRRETVDLVKQLRSISGQRYSIRLFDSNETIVALARAFNHSIVLGFYDNAITLSAAVDHVQNVLGTESSDTLALLGSLANAYASLGNLDEAISLYEQIVAHETRLLGDDHPHTLTSTSNLAYVYQNAGRVNEAIDLFETTLAKRTQTMGADHRATLTTRANLAGAYLAAGRLHEARELTEQVLTGRTQLLGTNHPDTLASRHNLAYIYRETSKFKEGIALNEEVLVEYKKRFGEDHPNTLVAENSLASAYQAAGRLDEARELYEYILNNRRRVLGDTHPHTLASIAFVAGAYRDAGRIDEATELYEQLLNDRMRIMGKDHPETLTAQSNLAGAYRDAGRINEATELYEQLLNDRMRIMGKDHPETLTAQGNLAGAYRDAGRINEATELYEQLLNDHMRIMGKDHPETLATYNNLASALQDAGRINEAINLYEKVSADCLSILGEDHPHTYIALANLAGAYQDAGRIDEALTFYQRVVHHRSRIIGRYHLDTIASRNNLAVTLQAAGRHAEAIILYEELLDDHTRHRGAHDSVTLNTRIALARAYESAKMVAKAIEVFDGFLSDCLTVLDPNNPAVTKLRASIAEARNKLDPSEGDPRPD